jgi:hypothetical protein
MKETGKSTELKSILSNAYTRGQLPLFLKAEEKLGTYDLVKWIKHGQQRSLKIEDFDLLGEAREPAENRNELPRYLVETLAPTPAPDRLILKAIIGTGSKKVALLNNQALGLNDERKIRLGETNVLVRCVSIGMDSISVRLDSSPTPVEIKMEKSK